MAFATGNQFWKARAKHGRDKIFSDPNMLWESACEYFQWTEDNPIYEDHVISFQGQATHEPLAKMRAMTLQGLWLFVGVSKTAWYEYKERDDFKEVISRIESVIYQQKFSGAAAGQLNSNIIARDLGLSDKQSQELTGANGGPVKTESTVTWTVQPVKPNNES